MLPFPVGFLGGFGYFFQDNFNRADSGTVGNGWVEDIGSWSISSNALLKDTSASGMCTRSGDTGVPDDQYAQLTAISASSMSPGVRLGDFGAGGDGYRTRIFSSTTIRLERLDDGTPTQIGSFSSGSYTGNEFLKTQAIGDNIKSFDESGEQISVTEGTYSTGVPGVVSTSTATTHTCDDFQAGSV